LMMLATAPVGAGIYAVLPRVNWFFTAIGLGFYIGSSQAFLLSRFARDTLAFVPGVTIGVFVATLIAAGDIYDISFLPLAVLSRCRGASLGVAVAAADSGALARHAGELILYQPTPGHRH
jgi:hypothetical protein